MVYSAQLSPNAFAAISDASRSYLRASSVEIENWGWLSACLSIGNE
jgi:hypothetical protein